MNGRFLTVKILMLSLFIFSPLTMIGGDDQSTLNEKDGKKEKAMKVLEISGAAQTYVEALLEGIKKAPISFGDKELYCKFATSESIMNYFIPVYMEKYTEEELDAMIDFYSSKVGQAIVKKSLPVVKELRKANMLWGMQISASVSSEKARIAAGKDK